MSIFIGSILKGMEEILKFCICVFREIPSDCSALVPFGIALAWMYPPHGTISFLRGPVANNHFFDILSLAVF